MMSNLFSVFDPSTTLMNISLNWLSTGLLFFMIPMIFWLVPSRIMMMWNMVSVVLYKEFKILLGVNKLTIGGTLLFISLFFFILFNNFMGLFSYVFTSSSHLVMNLSLALPLWMSFMIFGWFNYSIYMFAHLVPQGTPSLLMPFMVCIETISNLIRPGTLAIRLTANMIAGHLLMTLLGNMGSGLSTMLMSGLLFIQILLLSLELAVAIIQSYVFAVLSTLYAKEVV